MTLTYPAHMGRLKVWTVNTPWWSVGYGLVLDSMMQLLLPALVEFNWSVMLTVTGGIPIISVQNKLDLK